MKKKSENRLGKVNLKDETVLIFKKINERNYYQPLNNNALNYLKKEYAKYRKNKLIDIEYTIIDKEEATKMKFQLNLIPKLLDEIKIKKRGLVKITDDILLYINNKDLTPLTNNSEEKKKYINKLVTQPPIYCEDAWLQLNKKSEEYFSVL